MQVTVEIPDEYLSSLVTDGRDPARMLLEESVASAYREHRLSGEQVRKLLGLGTRQQVDVFLGKHEIYDYTVEDLEMDMATMDRLFGRSVTAK